jgi:hypothetical protein
MKGDIVVGSHILFWPPRRGLPEVGVFLDQLMDTRWRGEVLHIFQRAGTEEWFFFVRPEGKKVLQECAGSLVAAGLDSCGCAEGRHEPYLVVPSYLLVRLARHPKKGVVP